MHYSFDSKSLLRHDSDGCHRVFPIMGEIHYSRYPDSDWKQELLKMKAGGVTVVSSYVIWIHHEEIEGEWDFSGWRNLRKFVETVQDCSLQMMLRIGPWVHAEVRNGGFPDWLLKKCPENRCNNEDYFSEVQKFYAKTYEQVKGLLLKDGGPIIGIQIENEFGHCGGLSGAEGEWHMQRLTQIAKDVGFDVPLYTATGWGGAVTAGLLPVMGGYCEAPWDPRVTEIEPSGNYLFTYQRNDHAIGSDFGMDDGITFDPKKVPYLTAELGGGLQVTQKRRPVARPEDIGAMSLAKLGSGCNLLGYYMYHGGMNPEGKLTTLEENTASGSLNDMSVKNYDFRAPLGEYGQVNGSYKEIRLLSMFLNEYGERLCAMDADIPDDNAKNADDYDSLRYSWRYNGEHLDDGGFLFVNNFQRRRDLAEHDGVQFQMPKALASLSGKTVLPALDIYNGDYYVLPVHLSLGKAVLETSACMPLCVLHDTDRNGKNTYVFSTAAHIAGLSKGDALYSSSFFTPISQAENLHTGSLYSIDANDSHDELLTLSRSDALNAIKVTVNGCEHIIISESLVYSDNDTVCVQDCKKPVLKVYPEFNSIPEGFALKDVSNGFFIYEYAFDLPKSYPVTLEKKAEGCYELSVPSWKDSGLNELYVSIAYRGDGIRLYEKEKLLDDALFIGSDSEWTIGLKRFGMESHVFTLKVDALQRNASVFIENWPEFTVGDTLCSIDSVKTSGYISIRL
ncbi:MAG: beta-galactosidase [Treponema sp.]|nr:beta-galactosidase [Treponema sp.]